LLLPEDLLLGIVDFCLLLSDCFFGFFSFVLSICKLLLHLLVVHFDLFELELQLVSLVLGLLELIA